MTFPDPASLETMLRTVLGRHGLLCGAVLDASGDILLRMGDFGALENTGLPSALLGPYGSPKATVDSLEGQLLPQISSQGDDFAIIDKPRADTVVVFFGRGRRGPIDQFKLARDVATTVAEELKR
jgi:hypothetical protein